MLHWSSRAANQSRIISHWACLRPPLPILLRVLWRWHPLGLCCQLISGQHYSPLVGSPSCRPLHYHRSRLLGSRLPGSRMLPWKMLPPHSTRLPHPRWGWPLLLQLRVQLPPQLPGIPHHLAHVHVASPRGTLPAVLTLQTVLQRHVLRVSRGHNLVSCDRVGSSQRGLLGARHLLPPVCVGTAMASPPQKAPLCLLQRDVAPPRQILWY